jgi:hypothetical protein
LLADSIKTLLLRHEETCTDRNYDVLKCPYNPMHEIEKEKFDGHLEVCSNRPFIDENLKLEIRTYIENKKRFKITTEVNVCIESVNNMAMGQFFTNSTYEKNSREVNMNNGFKQGEHRINKSSFADKSNTYKIKYSPFKPSLEESLD